MNNDIEKMKKVWENKNFDKLKKSIEELQKIMPHLITLHKLECRIIRVKYEELIKQGFTKNEAIELLKNFTLIQK